MKEGKWKGGRGKSLPSYLHFFPTRRSLSQRVSYVSQQWCTSVTHSWTARVSLFSVFTSFWRRLWPITEQTQGNMECPCLIFHFTDTGATEKIFFRGNNNYLQTSWSAGKFQKYLYSFFMYTVTPLVSPEFPLTCWNQFHYLRFSKRGKKENIEEKEWRCRKCISLTNILYM